ncbi:hypothetical protein [Arcticibacterium luteifluviistationis]|nr:hypothetical protein [Arcticibacterium luteifluviistationis]
MKKFLLICFVCTFSVSSFSQHLLNNGTSFTNNLILNELEKDAKKIRPVNTEFEGTPYLNPEFQEGEVITLRGTFNPVNIRYNIYQDVMEFNLGGRNLYLDPSPLIKSIELDEQKFVVGDFPFKLSTVRGFLVELVAGEVSLYAKKNVSFREAQPPKALESAAHLPKLVKLSDTYYINRPNKDMVKVNSIKEIMLLLPYISTDLKKFVKAEKLSNKKIEDMVKLVSYINTLE